MSHPDIGTLHEYLDGELAESRRSTLEDHLAGCEACRTRLADARRVARDSGDLLAELEPGTTRAPAWEELRQRAESRASDGPGGGSWLKPGLAWAASIALAFVVGWSASNYMRITPDFASSLADGNEAARVQTATDRPSSPEATSSSIRAESPVSEARSDESGRGATVEREESGLADAPATEVPALEEATGRMARPSADLRDSEVGEEEPLAAGEAAGGARPAEPVAQDPGRAEADAAPDDRPVPTPPPASRQETTALTGDALRRERARPMAEARSERIWIDALAKTAVDEEQEQAMLNALREDVRQRSGFRAAAATLFHAVPPDEAERRMGGPLRTIPDLSPQRVEVGPGAAVPGALLDVPVVRLVYSDATGKEITLVQQRPGVGRRVEDEDDGLPTLTVSPSGRAAYRWSDAAGYRLVLIAELPGDSLRALADRIEVAGDR